MTTLRNNRRGHCLCIAAVNQRACSNSWSVLQMYLVLPTADFCGKKICISVITETQRCCQSALHSSNKPASMPTVKVSVAMHLVLPTAGIKLCIGESHRHKGAVSLLCTSTMCMHFRTDMLCKASFKQPACHPKYTDARYTALQQPSTDAQPLNPSYSPFEVGHDLWHSRAGQYFCSGKCYQVNCATLALLKSIPCTWTWVLLLCSSVDRQRSCRESKNP